MQPAKALAKLKKLTKAADEAMKEVYAAAPNRQTPFNECYAAASEAVRKKYTAAYKAMYECEFEGIAAGIWYRGTHGLLFWVQRRGRIGMVDAR